MRVVAVLLMIGAMLLAACNGDTDEAALEASQSPQTGGNDPTAPPGTEVPTDVGPAITVQQALDRPDGESLVVVGFLLVRGDGTLVLADELAESFPPQPAGSQVEVTGFDPLVLPLVEGPADAEIDVTSWTEAPVTLVGTVSDGTFTASPVLDP